MIQSVKNVEPNSEYDFVVIGGGPAGSTVATLLADAGKSVLVLEGSKFPRFAVGEIVAPTGLWRVWHDMGITREMLDERFIRKWNGAWQAPNGTLFNFEQDVHPEDGRCEAFVYTFDRATYDDFLLQHSRDKGAHALEEAKVDELLFDESGRMNGVKFTQFDKTHEVHCKLVIDASGRQNFIGKKLGLRMEMKELKSFASFAHYENVVRDEGDAEGDVRLIFGENMWFWWAPLKAPKASIGIVGNREVYYEEYKQDPEAFFDKYVKTCPFIWDRLKDAKRITGFRPVKSTSGDSTLENYHYYSTQFVGDGWMLCGDAAGFVDPIFSAGLYVAQTCAAWVAEEALAGLAEDDLSPKRLSRYQDRYQAEMADVMSHIQNFAEYYFDPKFVDFYLGLGNSSEKIRKLYIDTFVAYEPEAIMEYRRLLDRHFKDAGKRREFAPVA